MSYVFQGPMAQVVLTERELTLSRAALAFHSEDQSYIEQRRAESLMGQIQKARDTRASGGGVEALRVDAATCETLKRSLEELSTRPQYGDRDIQEAISQLAGRLGETHQRLTGENQQSRLNDAEPREETKVAAPSDPADRLAARMDRATEKAVGRGGREVLGRIAVLQEPQRDGGRSL